MTVFLPIFVLTVSAITVCCDVGVISALALQPNFFVLCLSDGA